MIKLQDKLTENIRTGSSKSYKTLRGAELAIEKYELKLNMTIDAVVVAVEIDGDIRFGVIIHSARSYMNEAAHRGFEMQNLLHRTRGMIIV